MSYDVVKNILFKFPPELAHKIALNSLNYLKRVGLLNRMVGEIPNKPRRVMNISFLNPVGLAAGLDKNGDYIEALSALGFGFIEVGTLTPRPQSGNNKPRLFRLADEMALINRMGFNNLGVEHFIHNMEKKFFDGILGVNIGKNFDTPLEKAANDYVFCLQKVYPYASYIVINISSPNTAQLRDLQYGKNLQKLLGILKTEQQQLVQIHKKYVPLVVKVAPDLNEEQIKEMAEVLLHNKIDGLIATNTTISRDQLKNKPLGNEQGGLSGAPLFTKALNTVRQFHSLLQDKIPIIACGGIMSGQDAKAMINVGASLVQIYTGFIYKGPELIKEIITTL